ncbi:Uncharacterized protein Fot_56528 [Forsythia ovata]|uniref:Uncharacterized protein n=1 Tax=Forsythia ovata TaxID=205694 RepID=A0ABD1P0B9_9LAMI
MTNSKYVGKASTRRQRSEATLTKVTSQSKKLMIKPEEQFQNFFEKYMTRHAPQSHRLGFRDFCRHPGIVKYQFLHQYKHQTDHLPSLVELMNLTQKADKSVVSFIDRWKSLASRATFMIPEGDAVCIAFSNI